VNLLDQAIEHANLIATFQKLASHSATDKTGAACNQNHFPQLVSLSYPVFLSFGKTPLLLLIVSDAKRTDCSLY
jgi:hypothetical protein